MDTALSTLAATAPLVQPARQAAPPRARPRWRFLLLALAGSAVLWLCYFPVGWGWLAWCALIPQMLLLRAETGRLWRYFCVWLAGLVFYGTAISWMTVADSRMIACWALLMCWCSLYPPLTFFLIRRLEKQTFLPLVLTFPAVWTAMEFVRSFLLTGFPWYLLGHTQHDALAVIQIADLGGAFAVSFLVAAVNAVGLEALLLIPAVRRLLGLVEPVPVGERKISERRLLVQTTMVALLLAGTLGYGAWRLDEDDSTPGPRLAFLQSDLDQRLKTIASRSPEAAARVREIYLTLCFKAAALQPRPDLIVWPETSCPTAWVTVEPTLDFAKRDERFRAYVAREQKNVGDIAIWSGTNVLLGLNTYVEDLVEDKIKLVGHYNSALLLNSKGKELGRYDKIHRVPFGEYLPLKDVLPFMSAFSPYDFDYSIGQGPGLTRLQLGKVSFGVLICYEDSDPAMARNYCVTTEDGPPVDFLLNISNDGWFDGSAEHEEHLAISRFRAIESHRPLARCANMGISALIDAHGRVLAPQKSLARGGTEVWTIAAGSAPPATLPISQWHEYKQVDGLLVVDMPLGHGPTVYAQVGDLLPGGCWALIGLGIAWRWKRRPA